MTTSGPDPSPMGHDELAQAAEAEADAAQARAEAAQARTAELRRTLEDAQDAPPIAAESSPVPRPPSALLQIATVVVTTLVTAGLLGATGYMVWQHRQATQQLRNAAEFVAAARQDVVNLMSMDFAKADESVQRVLDNSTGKFKANFDETADEFIKALRDEKILTTATINDAAVESMTGDSAVVLVSATSRREGKQAPKDQQQPRVWRVVINLEREGDQIKMSGVEFI